MTKMNKKPRALVGFGSVRADAADPKAVLENLNKAFAEFKAENDAELKAIRKDIVQSEKVDRINADITKLQTALDETNAKLAAARLGTGSEGKPLAAEKAAYAEGFDKFFRKGIDADLGDLAVKASLKTDSDPDGGWTAPEQMEDTIDRVLGTVSAMRSISRVVSISGKTYKKLVNQAGSSTGWVGERESRPETNTPTLAALDFPAMELYAAPAATQGLLDDSRVDIAAWLADEVSIAFAEAEGAAFITGDGVNKPRGLLSYDTIANASYAWGKLGYAVSGVAAAISDSSNNGIDGLLATLYGLKQGYRTNARWIMNRGTQEAIRKLKTATEKIYLWQAPVQLGQPASLLGYPITDDDNMQDIGAGKFPVAFGDFQRGYIIVDRMGIRVLRDPYTNKPYVIFYTTKRVGGGVQNFEAIKLLKIGTS